MTGFRFCDPMWLLLLIPLVLAALVAIRRRRRAAVLFSDVSIPRGLPVTAALRVKRLLPWLGVAAIAALIVALARPQKGRDEFRVQTEGVAIEMCLDRSGSMQAMDFELDGERVDRLAVCKKTFNDFVLGNDDLPGRRDDQIGLVAFGGFADDKCPLTLDHGVLEEIVDSTKVAEPLYDSQGRIINQQLFEEEQLTAVGDAVALAVDRLKDVDAKSKVIILLSDGESNTGVVMPEEAADAAKTYDIKIYSIGIGSSGVAPVPAIDPTGRKVLVPQEVRLDEQTLTMMADRTGGKYFNAKSTEALANVYAEIDQLEKTKTEGLLFTEYRDLYRYPTLLGLGLLLLGIGLASTRFRSLP
jgi:Ca-activated chloride channel family protein